jgi:hypothetical protein
MFSAIFSRISVAMTLLSLNILAGAQAAPSDTQRQLTPPTPMDRSCWHPGLARNIGIAEQSCDVEAVSRPRPNPSNNEDGPLDGGKPAPGRAPN